MARFLRADPRWARLGARLPDVDAAMRHRETLHRPEVLLVLLGLIPAGEEARGLAVGYISHMGLDFLTLPSRLLGWALGCFSPRRPKR